MTDFQIYLLYWMKDSLNY